MHALLSSILLSSLTMCKQALHHDFSLFSQKKAEMFVCFHDVTVVSAFL